MRVPLHDRLDDQVALVTGANRGLGRAIATGLAGLGATVYAGTRDPAKAPGPEGTRSLKLDVTQEGTVEQVAQTLAREHDHLDVLVNNAGTAHGARDDLRKQSMEEIDEILHVNLRGTILVTKILLPLLLKREGSRVVNMSSGMGNLDGMNGGAPGYRISKTGVNSLTTYLHGEYHDTHGLISNCVCPGWVRTRMGGPHAERDVTQGAETPVWLCRFAPDAPSGLWWRDQHVIPW